jgi:hypothetical protein
MEESRAQRMVEVLRARGAMAHVERSGVYQFGIGVRVDGDRVAIWDSDGTAGLEAQVMRNGMLVGFVPTIPGSEDFTEDQVIAAIIAADYDAPIARSAPSARTTPAPGRGPGRGAGRPAAGPGAGGPSSGGVLRRLFGGGQR